MDRRAAGAHAGKSVPRHSRRTVRPASDARARCSRHRAALAWRARGDVRLWLSTLGRSIARELVVADDAAALALEGLTLELLGALVRHRRGSARSGPPPQWLRRARESIDDRYRERALRIADLAEGAGADPASLARAFRAHYGTTAGAYLREVRVRRAADALARSSAALSQIALDSGFADQSHFTRVFGSVHGMTPRRWRARHGK